jgi:DNA-binding MarR family transcriptional regulator
MLLRDKEKMGKEFAASEHRVLLGDLEIADVCPSEISSSSAEFTSPQRVRAIIKARAVRRKFFNEQLFADPAWDMLLELYALRCEDLRISVSKLSHAAGVPSTTALRWIDKLESEELLFRAADPLDGRRIWIELSAKGMQAMRAYLQHLSGGTLPI